MLDALQEWLRGDLTPAARIWSAVFPAIMLIVVFGGGLLVYLVRCAFKGQVQDQEVASRNATFILGRFIRNYFVWLTSPIWWMLRKSQLPPNAITILSAMVALSSGIAMAAGRFAIGGWLYIAAGACDFMDGRLARDTGMISKRGGALDSILDRYADTLVLAGLAIYYGGSWVLALCLFAILGALLTSYIRAKAESLGVSSISKVGAMQRPERIAILGTLVALSPIPAALWETETAHPFHHLAVIGIGILAVLGNWAAIARFAYLLRALPGVNENEAPVSGVGRGSLVRSVVTSAIATGIDFVAVLGLVTLGLSPVLSTLIGCVLGGITNFALNRSWGFVAGNAHWTVQFGRYVIVSATSALLNAGGVAAILLLECDYRIAWWVTRLVVFVAWNYPLQRNFVFAPAPESETTPQEC